MSDFETRIKALEEARAVQDQQMATLLQQQASQDQRQAQMRQEIQRLDAKIEAVQRETTERIRSELQVAWSVLSSELDGMLTAEQLSRVHDVARGCLEMVLPPPLQV
jgi:uncharacterized coiled-coil protein SlyX